MDSADALTPHPLETSHPGLRAAHHGDVTVVEFLPSVAQLDEGNLPAVAVALRQLAKSANPPCVILDLSNVSFFGSSFIETVFLMMKDLEQRGSGRISLCGVNPYPREVLQITHLDKLWPMYDDLEEALAALREKTRTE